MKTLNLKHIIGTFILGLLIGILIPYLFFNDPEPASTATLITPKQILEREKEINTAFNARITTLETKNSVLQKSLDSTRLQLSVLKAKTKKRTTTIKKMLEPVGVPASSLLRKIAVDSSNMDCDSLKKEVSSFLNEIEQKDAAYEMEIQFLNESLFNKDSIILLLRWQQQEKDTLLATAVQQLELVNTENQQLKKKIKKRKLGATLKTIGLMIATGATTHAISNL